MNILGLDIGTRRTGVSFVDDANGVVIALDTIEHDSKRSLFAAIRKLIDDRSIAHIMIGLPLLPSGEEGAQARMVRAFAQDMRTMHIPVSFVDERYTSSEHAAIDGDAAAAVAILQSGLERINKAKRHNP